MRLHLTALAALLLTVPALPLLAQSAEKPLGDILDSIEDAGPPPLPSAPRPSAPPPVPRDGVGTMDLPASNLPDQYEPAPDEGFPAEEQDVEAAPRDLDEPGLDGEPPVMTEEERMAEWQAEEDRRLESLDRARAEREEAQRRAYENSRADYERRLADRDAAIARAEADYRAAVERTRRRAAQERALWQARVRACEDGDRDACAQPGEY